MLIKVGRNTICNIKLSCSFVISHMQVRRINILGPRQILLAYSKHQATTTFCFRNLSSTESISRFKRIFFQLGYKKDFSILVLVQKARNTKWRVGMLHALKRFIYRVSFFFRPLIRYMISYK